MFELKQLSPEALPAALEKAQRYRYLNEPFEAESICMDILAVDPGHQEATILQLLAATDQFERAGAEALSRARSAQTRIRDPYLALYFCGIVLERWAKARLRRGGMESGPAVYDLLTQAMAKFEEAARLRPPGEDETLLRWNTCARLIESRPNIRPASREHFEPVLE
jgi:hypothetical protein